VLATFLLSLFIVGGCHGPRPVLRFHSLLDQERPYTDPSEAPQLCAHVIAVVFSANRWLIFGGDLFRPNRLQATPGSGSWWQSDAISPACRANAETPLLLSGGRRSAIWHPWVRAPMPTKSECKNSPKSLDKDAVFATLSKLKQTLGILQTLLRPHHAISIASMPCTAAPAALRNPQPASSAASLFI